MSAILRAHFLHAADGQRIIELLQMGRKGDEDLGGRQRVAIGVVRPMDGQTERAREA
jgi:hypothetical protein